VPHLSILIAIRRHAHAGGIDRYFQLARCYRDEGGRSDRQPEFTQIDLEMSFVDASGVMDVVETAVKHAWNCGADEALQLDPVAAFPRMTYATAMERFGSDKPDTRVGLEMQPLPELLTTLTQPHTAGTEEQGEEGVGVVATVAATSLVLRCEAKWAPGDTKRLRKLLGAQGPGAGSDGGTGSAGAELGVIKIQGEGKYRGDRLPGGHEAVLSAIERLQAQPGDVCAHTLSFPRSGFFLSARVVQCGTVLCCVVNFLSAAHCSLLTAHCAV
jgi:hypothetical protein